MDRRTVEAGIPGVVLMENAAHRVVEFLAGEFAPLRRQRIAVLCGKGNNGGDGLAIARLLHVKYDPEALHVVLFAEPEELQGDAAANFKMLAACGYRALRQIPPEAQAATIVVDALLGTGVAGPAKGRALDGIHAINQSFPLAKIVAVDLPSGMASDSRESAGEVARATTGNVHRAEGGACAAAELLIVSVSGSRVRSGAGSELLQGIELELVEPAMFADLLAPRERGGHKGTYGHALVVAGGHGKTGAAAMAGMGALRAGAGLVTVASEESALAAISAHAAELMTAALAGNLGQLAEGKTVLAIGPGLGRNEATDRLVKEALGLELAVVIDADALMPGIAGSAGKTRVLTPHPGEMARLTGQTTAELQKNRLETAREFAAKQQVTLVLKGERSLIAFADGRVWINPTGTPAMGTGGTGDVLTGMIAGLLAQFLKQPDEAVAAAVYLHGLAGELGAAALGEKSLVATDLLTYLPAAIREAIMIALWRSDDVDAETVELGRTLAKDLPRRGVVLLIGNLGAGKTTLAAIVSGLGVLCSTMYRPDVHAYSRVR